jgi:hypothetical protein
MTSKKTSWYVKSWFLWILVALVIFGFYKGYKTAAKKVKHAKGFTIEKILMRYPEVARSNSEKLFSANQILNQPYFFLGKGKQFFVFQSADGKYVIKFFQQQRFALGECFGFLPECLADYFRAKKKAARQKRYGKMVESIELAASRIQKETGILFCHLGKTEGQYPDLQVLDKKGTFLSIPLDNVQFVLQKKAELLKPTLVKLMHDGKEEAAKQKIDAMFQTLVTVAKAGIEDEDGALVRNDNLGIIDNEAIYFDVGKFVDVKGKMTPALFAYDLRKLRPLYNWLKKNYPSLAVHFEECRERAIGLIS